LTTEFEYATHGHQTQAALKREAELKEQRKDSLRKRWRRRWVFLKTSFKTLLILLLVAIFAWVFRDRIFYSVDSGEVLLVYYRLFGGTSHNQIGREGLHIIAPWDLAYRYQIRTQTILLPMTVMSRDGLEVHVDAQIRFNAVPETVPYLHRRYGPDYAKTIIIPQLTESVQGVIGQFRAEDLYSFNRAASVGRIFARARRLIGGVYVHVEDIGLFNVKLPDRVQSAIQGKVEADQNAQAAAFSILKEQNESQRKEIEAQGIQHYNEIVKGIPQSVLIWKGIEATLELAKSPNSKIIVMGSKDNLPLMLGNVPDLAAK
jgi:regulator of protease activity HflC (stomatin/prohibitin superfamily)